MVFDGKGVNLKRPVRRPWKACFGRAVYLSLFSVKASATPSRLKIARQLSAFEMIRAPLRIKAMTQQVPPLAAPFFRNFASVVPDAGNGHRVVQELIRDEQLENSHSFPSQG